MSRLRRRILRTLAILGGGGVLTLGALAAAVAWLNTEAGNDWLRGQLLTQAAPYLPEATLELDRLHLSLLGEVELTGIRLARSDGTLLLDIASVRLSLDPAELLGDEVNLGALSIDRPIVRLEVLEDGTLDWIRALGLESTEDPTEPAPWEGLSTKLGIEASLTDGALVYVTDGAASTVTDIGLGVLAKIGGGAAASLHELHLDFVPHPYDPVGLSGDLRYQDSVVTFDTIDVNFGDTAAELFGNIYNVEVSPALSLELSLLPIAAGVASPWTGDQTPSQDINLTSRIRGPLSNLRLDAALSTVSGQQARLTGQVDLTAEPLSWEAALATEALDLDPLVPAITESVRLAGSYTITGSGTEWPAGITARIVADAPEQVIWGQRVEQLRIDAALSGGKLRFTEAMARHPVGTARILSGAVDLVREEVDLVVDAALPALSALSEFGLSGYRGSAEARGPVKVAYGVDPLTIDANLVASGRRIGSADFSLDALQSASVTVSVIGESVSFSGGATLGGLEASGVLIESLTVSDLVGSYLPSGVVDTSSTVRLSRLQVGDGTFVLDDLQGSVIAGVDAGGLPILDTALQLGGMNIAPINYSLDGGPVELELRDNSLFTDLVLRRNDRVVMNTRVRGELAEGRWRVEELLLFPADKRGLAIPTSRPVEFQVVEDGVEGVELVLVLSSEDPDVVDPRQLDIEQASYITLSGGTAGAEPDVSFSARRVDMAWVSEIVNVFFSAEDGTPAVAAMSGLADADLKVRGFDAAASLEGSLELTQLTYPELVDGVSGTATLAGRLGRPEASMTLRDPRGLLFAARGVVPLDLEAGSLPCDESLAVRAMVAPTTLKRLSRRLPVTGELPPGELSADVHITGPVCDPVIAATAALATPIGAQGEYGRVDLTVTRGEEGFVLEAGLDEGGIRRVSLDGTATDRLADVITWAVEGGPEPDLADPETYISDISIAMVPLGLPISLALQLLGQEAEVEGALGGVVQLSGTIDDPQALAVLTLSDAQVGDVRLDEAMLNLLPAVGDDDEHDGYTLESRLDFEGEGTLEVEGRIPLTLARLRDEELEALYTTPGWQLGFVGEGWLPLAALNGVVDGVEGASGDLRLSGDVTGSLDVLDPTARFRIDGGTIGYLPLEVIYEEIDVDVRISSERVRLRPSSMTSRPMFSVLGTRDPGTLSAEGTIALSELSPAALDLTATLEDFWLSGTDDMRIAASTGRSPLAVTGAYPALKVRGDIVMTEGIVVLGESFWVEGGGLALDDRIRVVRSQDDSEEERTAPKVEEPSELMKQLDARVSVDLNKKLKVTVEMPLSQDLGQQFAALSMLRVDAELGGQLNAGYRNNNISLDGDVEFARGDIESFGRSFTIDDSSVVHFTGANYSNPNLEMAARYTTSSYGDVVMNVGGTALSPTFGLKSENTDQSYDETDLFAILLLGKPASAMADSEGESNSALMSAALSQVTGSVGSALSGTLVDEVDWDPDSGVRVGKAINDKLFLSYDWNNDPEEGENRNQVTLEWLVSRRAFAEFVTGDEAQSSAELYWRVLFGEQVRDPPQSADDGEE